MVSTPKAITRAAAGAHQLRPKRRITKISSAPPAAASTAPIAVLLATSPAYPVQLWVTSPTSFARSRAIARMGSVTSEIDTDSAAAAAAPARTWRRRTRSRRAGGRRTIRTSRASSTAVCAPNSHSWPVLNDSAFSTCAALK